MILWHFSRACAEIKIKHNLTALIGLCYHLKNRNQQKWLADNLAILERNLSTTAASVHKQNDRWSSDFRVTEEKPRVVHEFTSNVIILCDTNYIGNTWYICRHLFQCVEEHKHSVIEKHFRNKHSLTSDNFINYELTPKSKKEFVWKTGRFDLWNK